MKRVILSSLLILAAPVFALGQDPIPVSRTAEKTSANTYRVYAGPKYYEAFSSLTCQVFQEP